MAAPPRYQSVFQMRWLHEQEYAADHDFAAQDFVQVTVDDVLNYFNYLVRYDTSRSQRQPPTNAMSLRYNTIQEKITVVFLTDSVNNFQLNDNFNVAGVGHINGGGGVDIIADKILQYCKHKSIELTGQ